MTRAAYRIGLGIAALAALALTGANLALGDLNQDEGWYLYAARLVAEGQMPYRDFAFMQGPVMPAVYSAVSGLTDRWGLAAGRAFTALLGLAGACLASALAGRLAPQGRRGAAALVAFSLIAVNVYQSYYCTVVKTYALAGLALAGGLWLLAVAESRRSRWAAALAGAAVVAAAGTRSSIGVVAALAFAYLVLCARRLGFHAWLWYALGSAAAGAIALLPFFLAAPEGFWFFVVKYHTLRESGGLGEMLAYKAGFLSRMVQAYFVAASAWAAIVLARGFGLASPAPAGDAAPRPALGGLVWACAAALTLVHVSAPFPYDDYQVVAYPLFAAALAAAAVRLVAGWKEAAVPWLCMAVLLSCAAASCSSPVNQGWFIGERDRIWWRMKDQAPLARLQEVGAYLRTLAGPGDLLLTQDPYLAVESGMAIPRGLEMGQFSYFPGLDPAAAARLKVLNREQFEALLETCDAPVAALSGYAFAIRSPQIDPVPPEEEARFRAIVDRRYEPVRDVPDFGQAGTLLRLYRRRAGDAGQGAASRE